MDEVDPIESEPKPKDEKPQPKIPNGTLPNCTSSPDSGHPSSRNFSVTSGLSDCSPSTEDASTQENGSKIKLEPSVVTSEVTVDLPTNYSLECKLEESSEQCLQALGTEEVDPSKSPIGDLPPEDEVIKPQENEKVKNLDAKEVSRTDTVKSMDYQWDLNEKSKLNVSETAESTCSEHSEENAKHSESNEKSKQIHQSREATAEEITKTLEGTRDLQIVVETQLNIAFIDDRDTTKKNVALVMQSNKETPSLCVPLRELPKDCSVKEAKTIDTSPVPKVEDLKKSELTSDLHMETLEEETQPSQLLSNLKMTSGSHTETWEEETKPPQPFSETKMTNAPDVEPCEKETKLPQPHSESDITSAPDMEPMEKEPKLPQPLFVTEMTSAPDMEPTKKEIMDAEPHLESEMNSASHIEPLEKEIKSSQTLSELKTSSAPDMESLKKSTKLPQTLSETEITSAPDMKPTEKEIKLPQTLSETEMTSAPDMKPTEKEIKHSQSLSESEITSASHREPSKKETKIPQSHSESEMISVPDMEPTEKEIKPPQPLYESDTTSNSQVEPSEKERTKPPQPPPESQDSELIMNNTSISDKPDMKTVMNWSYDSNRTKALLKQINEPLLESCISIMSLSKQSPDTSDDSPSALEMEEIPAALVYMPSEDILANVPITLGPPLALTMPPEKTAVGMPALELCMEAGQNTSPEATESALSDEEPEMESLLPKPDSLAVGDHKTDVASPVSSIGTTYSVS